MFDWLYLIIWEEDCFFLGVNETEDLDSWLQTTETTESKLECPNEQIFSLQTKLLRIFFLINRSCYRGFLTIQMADMTVTWKSTT